MIRFLFLFTYSCSRVFLRQQRPNILFIFSDDHDADAISVYNKTLISTPGIDRLAKEGMKFNKHFVQMPFVRRQGQQFLQESFPI